MDRSMRHLAKTSLRHEGHSLLTPGNASLSQNVTSSKNVNASLSKKRHFTKKRVICAFWAKRRVKVTVVWRSDDYFMDSV